MNKSDAIEQLGGTVQTASRAIGVTHAAISQWPATLPPRLADRVQAALWRKYLIERAVSDVVDRAQAALWRKHFADRADEEAAKMAASAPESEESGA